jgi:hypothetical protein
MNDQTQVDAQKVIADLLDQLKQANLQMAILRVMVADANLTPLEESQILG